MLCCKYLLNCLFRIFNYANIDGINKREFTESELHLINEKLSIIDYDNSQNIIYSSFSSINNYDLL